MTGLVKVKKQEEKCKNSTVTSQPEDITKDVGTNKNSSEHTNVCKTDSVPTIDQVATNGLSLLGTYSGSDSNDSE